MMDKQVLVKQLRQLRPFTIVPPKALELLVEMLEPIALPAPQSHPLLSLGSEAYLLALHGTLVLHKAYACRSRPFTRRLPLGGLQPVPKPTRPDVSLEVQFLTDGLLGILSNASLQTLCQETAVLRLAFIHSICLTWKQVTEDTDYRISLPLSVQLAHLLLELAQVQDKRVVVPFTHWQIAILLGSHRETISAIIGQFRQQGWLETRKGSMQLLDVPALAGVAQDQELLRKL